MGKERKPQTGATNLSARIPPPLSPSGQHPTQQQPQTQGENDGHNQAVASSSSAELVNGVPKIQRGIAHKLLAPDLYKTANKETHYAKLKVTATWTPLGIYKRDFETTHADDYRDPNNVPTVEHHSKTTLDIATEAIKEQDEVDAINNMCKLVRTSYGTVATMLRSVSWPFLTCFLVVNSL